MGDKGRTPVVQGDGAVLRWPGRVVTAGALERSLNGHREIALPERAVITPLAAEFLKAHGVRVLRQAEQRAGGPATPCRWGFVQQRSYPAVASAAGALRREGLDLQELALPASESPDRWAQAVAACVANGTCQGGAVFCEDPAPVCCVANKVPGLRAAAVLTVAQAARALRTLGANLLVVEMPGRTLYEVRQILRGLCNGQVPVCPPALAGLLKELDGHAHR